MNKIASQHQTHSAGSWHEPGDAQDASKRPAHRPMASKTDRTQQQQLNANTNGNDGNAGAGANQQRENPVNAATLSPLPRSLYILWQEYEVGIGLRKAARLFTAEERGRSKYSYHRRKVVWDAIAYQVRAGHTADMAIDRIYNVYGRHTRVTAIINRMRIHRTQYGGQLHPELR